MHHYNKPRMGGVFLNNTCANTHNSSCKKSVLSADVFVGCMMAKQTPTFVLFSDEAWLHLGGCVNTQNNGYWSPGITVLSHKESLLDYEVGVALA